MFKTQKIVEAEALNISKLLGVMTGEAGEARVSQVHRQKYASNYRNEACNKTRLQTEVIPPVMLREV